MPSGPYLSFLVPWIHVARTFPPQTYFQNHNYYIS